MIRNSSNCISAVLQYLLQYRVRVHTKRSEHTNTRRCARLCVCVCLASVSYMCARAFIPPSLPCDGLACP
jgi:hypothetical protein